MLAKTILMFEELRNYEFYYASSGTIYLYIVYNGEIYTLDVMVNVLLNDVFTINIDNIVNGFFEIELTTESAIDFDLVKTQYETYVAEETYLGYVLPNYKQVLL